MEDDKKNDTTQSDITCVYKINLFYTLENREKKTTTSFFKKDFFLNLSLLSLSQIFLFFFIYKLKNI